MAPLGLTWTLKLVLTLGAKNWVRPKRDDNFQCGGDFYPKVIVIQPKLLLNTSHIYTIGCDLFRIFFLLFIPVIFPFFFVML